MGNWSRRDMLKSGAALGAASLGLTTPSSVRASPGNQQWAFETGGGVYSSPTVVDGTVYIGSNDANLYAVDAASGDKQWAFETGWYVVSSPTVVDGTVYIGSNDGNLYAVNAASGDKQWAFETGAEVSSSPTVVDGTVYVGSYDGNLYAVDAGDGTEKWRFETGKEVWSSPTVVDGTVYVGSYDDNLYAVDAASGEKQWAYETGGGLYSSPTVVDGTVYVGGDDTLYAVEGGVAGSSEGSRVLLGTLGHHHSWTGEMPPADFKPGYDTPEDQGFDPARHGFGFDNWGTISDEYPGHNHNGISLEEVRKTINTRWPQQISETTALSDSLGALAVEPLALHIYTNVNQGAATNGHCYGMVYASDAYYQDPQAIPVDVETASQVPKPTGQYTPVGDDIDYYHNTQLLDFNTYAARLAVFGSKKIDYSVQLNAITNVIDETGTAGLTLHSTSKDWEHQIMAVGYTQSGNTVELDVYDPESAADAAVYANESLTPTVTFDIGGDRTTVEPYDGVFDRLAYTNADGRIDPQAMLLVGTVQAGEWLADQLSSVVTFLTQSPVELTVIDPDGHELLRFQSEHMSLEPTEYDQIRTRFGAQSGEYDVELTGTADGSYTLQAVGKLKNGITISERVHGEISEGERHQYKALLPEKTADEESQLTAVPTQRGSGGMSSWLPIAGGAALLGGAGLAAYRLLVGSNEESKEK